MVSLKYTTFYFCNSSFLQTQIKFSFLLFLRLNVKSKNKLKIEKKKMKFTILDKCTSMSV